MTEAEQSFRSLHAQTYEDLMRFVRRRVPPSDAEDVLAAVFTIVWRRLDQVPADARPWLFAVARNVLANQARWRVRHGVVDVRMVVAGERGEPDATGGVVRAERPPARRGRVLVLAAGAVLAAGLVAVPSLGPGGSEAYASWTPTPRTVAGGQVLSQAQACLGERPDVADIVLAEQRGEATLLIARRRDGELMACTILDPDDGVAGAEVLDRSADRPGPARVSIQSMGATGDRHWYSEVIGRVGAGVTAVDVVLPDGAAVRASATGGWWAAWWPGHEGGEVDTVRIVVHTAAGQQTYRPSQL
ncbi:MAG: sigma-70 family RNA polymerase sigma factor [Actinoplanes sp.]